MKPTGTRHARVKPHVPQPPVSAAILLLAACGAWLAGFPVAAPVRAFMNDALVGSVLGLPHLVGVSAKNSGSATTVTIEASDPVAYVTSQPDPLTVLVDLRNVRASGISNGVTQMLGSVAAVSVEDTSTTDGAPLARVRVRLTHPAAHFVRSARNLILIEIGKQPLAASTIAADRNAVTNAVLQAAASTPDEIVPLATVLNTIRTSQEGQGTVVTLTGDGRLEAGNIEEALDAPRLYVDFPKVVSVVPNVTEVRQGPIERIRVSVNGRKPLVTRVVLELNRKTIYWVQPPEDDSRDFRIVFENQSANTDAAIFAAQIGGPRQPSPLDPMTALTLRPVQNVGSTGSNVVAIVPSAAGQATVRPVTPAAPIETPKAPAPVVANVIGPSGPVAVALAQAVGAAQPPAPPAPPAPPQGPIVPPAGPGTITGQGRVYTGQPVVLDFQGADLRAVLRTFAEISGLNMVIDPAVQGTVDVALRDVPWDQALDIILRANKLGYSIDGTIVRIAPLTVLADEEAQRRKLSEEQALSGELRVFTRSLSYAKAEDIAPLLVRTALTQRGTVQVDARTNTLIITDLPNALQTVTDLIGTLDKAQPQVEIEARIVQTSRNFARTLGVNWGFNGRVAQDLGNTTGLAFPNQGSLTGRTGGVQGPIQGEIIDHAATVVNLGVGGAASAIGLALGSVNGALNLDLALSALEQSGQGHILSTPRVSTQNNIEAEITQGLQIPIQTVANNTVTVTFKDAALTLRVTPQITAANTVIMRIAVENATPDFSRAVNLIPPIDTQRAITQVLVADGETTVIGGIYINNQQTVTDRTPVLSRIPLLGWLFKRDDVRDNSRELLIFITPRITKM